VQEACQICTISRMRAHFNRAEPGQVGVKASGAAEELSRAKDNNTWLAKRKKVQMPP
jgi:hypothetical protein